MSRGRRLCLSAILLSVFSLATLGCADHHYYRAYDPYYNDYHRWDDHERVYYEQWARENHRELRPFSSAAGCPSLTSRG
jgi:hypothetical protein